MDANLSKLRHCSKGAQLVPKTAYHSGIRNKHSRPAQSDSNLGFLTFLLFLSVLFAFVLGFVSLAPNQRCWKNVSEITQFVSNATQNADVVTCCTVEQVEEAVAVLHAHQAKEAAGFGKVE